ncbi:radical SAM protein [Streptomyces sp. NPDC048252]|uniref:radical SAM/SPASM domain-containing protein n=1 Tax=Streptomyces sp. NPDC048252 TaxID=3154612 RepID=UPI0034372C02
MNDLRPSRYAIHSDSVYAGSAGQRLRLVYGTRRAVTLALTEEAADQLRTGHVPSADPALLQRLIDVELVVPADDELDALVTRSRQAAQTDALRTITLMPTSYCNMGCTYCGQQHTKGRLPASHRDAIASRVERAITDDHTKDIRVRWFGGEPMMGYAILLDLSKRFVDVAERAGVSYSSSMVTNGSLLTLRKLRRLQDDALITKLCITVDGPEQIHDRSRILKSGGVSFQHITKLIAQALADEDLTDITFELRTNVTRANADHIDDYLHQMAALGFAHPQVIFNLEPVHSWSNDISDIALSGDEYAAREIGWLTTMLDLGLKSMIVPTASKPIVCGAVTTSTEIISSTGAIFSCSEQPLVPKAEANEALARITDVELADKRPEGPFDDWHDRIQAKEVPCAGCPMLGVCGGSCPKLWSEGFSPCPSYKRNFQQRLALVARKHHLTPVS